MRIRELLQPSAIKTPILASEKEAALAEVAGPILATAEYAPHSRQIMDALLARERLMSTGIGRGIAIPHAELDSPSGAVAAAGISPQGIEFAAPDGQPVSIVFLMVVSRDLSRERIELLSVLSRIFRKQSVRDELRRAGSAEALLAILNREEDAIREAGPPGSAR